METLIGTKHQENQDVIRVAEGIYIICDGHGSNGKEVASFVASTLIGKIFYKIDKCLTELGDGKITKSVLWDIFKKTEFDLEISGLDIAFSGCACILVLKRSNQIMCATVGDSKAFIRCGYKN
jgi:serine/threonine protein phosphatase PrpC